MKRQYDRKLVLEDGVEYYGYAFGDKTKESVCEIVFNTSMIGYQEIVSDPTYTAQAVVMTYPIIGNYGIADEDYESRVPTIGCLIVREYNDSPSNFRYTKTLSEILEENRIPGIEGIDTRRLTRSIRDNGSCRALITSPDTDIEAALAKIKSTSVSHNAVETVSCKKKWYSRTSNHKYNVVTVDCGVKLSIIKALNQRGCNVTVMPWNTAAAEIEKISPDGILISNGPGDPQDAHAVSEMIQSLRGKYPLLGIGLGHQLICSAYGADSYKMKLGHRGGNCPVKNLLNGEIEITTQNHGYAISAESLEKTELSATHINLLDNTVEGAQCVRDRVFSVQYHPDSAPGPKDSTSVFDRFIKLMEEKSNA